ncbi:DNA mismatch repair protein MutS [Hyphomicrobium sp. D-2]|uniref:DNA mismatch repair protein MutS n=1 Tax=Hyphomicrobium sp. D-2 TaxID=3041621 RepID=UPI002454DDD6|nr:DNA mismatch repair protein MutS [Hyphomicrobium sp. D-2]MDH4983138.1 DNA mismatch repair protein MutS [Hyphomicrobium sp. D-2]
MAGKEAQAKQRTGAYVAAPATDDNSGFADDQAGIGAVADAAAGDAASAGATASAATGQPLTTPSAIADASPSMAQFLEIKAAHPDCLLWYRMGDFYELFFEDAAIAAATLGIVLTKRGKHAGQDIPMCGVPVHRADEYLQRLIRAGHRVAVAEQLEDPAEARKRGSKSVVRRDVVRLVTPGTITEEALLDAKVRNYLTALFRPPVQAVAGSGSAGSYALASVDISTGEMEVGEIAAADLPGELARLAPGEVITSDAVLADADVRGWIVRLGAAATPVPNAYFDSLGGEASLKKHLKVAELGGFGSFTRAELAALGAILKYIELTQMGQQPALRPPKRSGSDSILLIDAASRASLELVRSASGDRQGSLLSAIDRTVTGSGARELAARLASPLRDVARINARLDAVGYLIGQETLRSDLRAALNAAPDIARATSRLSFGRGSPRDLAAVRDGLACAARCADLLENETSGIGLPEELQRIASEQRAVTPDLSAMLTDALVEDPPHLKRDGNFVRPGYRTELDDVRRLKEDGRGVIAGLEAKYVEQTGVKSLKVRHNNILGYFIEVTQGNAKPLLEEPLSSEFRHRQTMASAVRFTTIELSEIEGRIASASERALSLEQEIFADLARAIEASVDGLGRIAAALAELDATAALAELAREEDYVRPVVDNSRVFDIRGGRHPVVEQALRAAKAGAFIENDCVLSAGASASEDDTAGVAHAPATSEHDGNIWLVTGPNMAGKSTFLRQNALIAVLAQMGAYVPARSATIGALDRLFSRVGASDDLARGRSTFMVEMVETAAILNQASDRSLVILDEIGRGTATFDGLSIAWATVEYLHDVLRARALFATHYHELTDLARRLAGVVNVTIDVREWQDDIVFLHKVKSGAADRSYGIQVAKLAGLPEGVVGRAREVLALLEKSERGKGARNGGLDDLPLFAASQPAAPPPQPAGPTALEMALDAMQPDELTPRAALDAIYRLKALRTKHS